MQQIIEAFKFLYMNKLVHRDLKLSNLLVSYPGLNLEVPEEYKEDHAQREQYVKQILSSIDLHNTEFVIKLADFGFAKTVEDMSGTVIGTPLNIAPEVLKGKSYNNQIDVWSLGVVFFELLTGFTPFNGRDMNDLQNQIERGVYKIPKKLKLSLRGLSFLNGCLQYDPSKRLNWE